MKQHHVFYVPGILDDKFHVQSALVATWRLYGISSHTHPMPWAGDETYEPKLKRLLAAIDTRLAEGHRVSLVGASAGASAVINAFVERPEKITSLVYICGKINRPESIGQELLNKNPAFKTAMQVLQKNLRKLTADDKRAILSLYSPADTTVPHTDTQIIGVKEQPLPKLGHGWAIIYSLTVGAPTIINHLKRQAAAL